MNLKINFKRELIFLACVLVFLVCGYFFSEVHEVKKTKNPVISKIGNIKNEEKRYKIEVIEIKTRELFCIIPIQTYQGVKGRRGNTAAPTFECIRR